MSQKKIGLLIAFIALTSALCSAANFSFSGTFTDVNQVQYFTFTVSANQHIVIRTYGYAGGTTSAGQSIPAGGFDPLLAVFNGTGGSATLLYKSDDAFECAHVNQDPTTRQCYDAYLDKAGAFLDPTTLVGGFDAGTYTLVLMNYANFAKGPTLGDGFAGNGGGADCFGAPRAVTPGAFLDCNGATRTGKWAVDISGADTAELASAPGTPFKVLSPNGGESVAAGTPLTIQWSNGSVTGNVDLALLKAGAALKSIATGVPASAGSFLWTVPTTVPVGSDYTVRVMSSANSSVRDVSDAAFSVTAPLSSVTVVSPNGGESWPAGTAQTLTWNAVGLSGNVNIALLKAGVGFKSIGTAPASAGTFSWTLPSNLPVASDYKIRVTSATDSTMVDASDNTFSIAAPLTRVTVIAPNGGESWAAGTVHDIVWNAVGLSGNVNIALLKAGVGFKSVATVAASAGSFSYTLPANLPVASDYTVRVTSATDGAVVDVSDAAFSVAAPLVFVSVLSPNGGETWTLGSTHTIQWNAPGVTTVNIALLKAGVGFKSLATGVSAASGSFSWTLPVNLPAASDYTIRVMSATDGTIVDISNATFTIAP